MLKLKDSVNFIELKKYGFYVDVEPDDILGTFYYIRDKNDLVIDEITREIKIDTCWDLDSLYYLIKDDLIEIIENKQSDKQ